MLFSHIGQSDNTRKLSFIFIMRADVVRQKIEVENIATEKVQTKSCEIIGKMIIITTQHKEVS